MGGTYISRAFVLSSPPPFAPADASEATSCSVWYLRLFPSCSFLDCPGRHKASRRVGHRPRCPHHHVVAWRWGCKVYAITLLLTHHIVSSTGAVKFARTKRLDFLLMYLEMSVTSSDVDVTSAISSNVDLTSPISSNVGLTTPMWKQLNVYWVFVTTGLARKFRKNFSEFPLKRSGTFFLFFALKKLLSGTETVARRVSSWRPSSRSFFGDFTFTCGVRESKFEERVPSVVLKGLGP